MMALNGLTTKEVKEVFRHSMAGSKIKVERRSNGEVKVESDREVDGKQM